MIRSTSFSFTGTAGFPMTPRNDLPDSLPQS